MSNWVRIKSFLRSNQKELKFILLFILYFVLGQAIHYGIRPYTNPLFTEKMHVALCSKIINTITPEENTCSENSKLIGAGGFQVSVATGCDGVDGILLVVAAICAFKMGIFRKLAGLIAGCLIIYICNLTRIILLYYTIRYKPALFDAMHFYFGQIFIVLVGITFFIAWLNMFGESIGATD